MAERSAEPLPACFAGLGAGSPRPRQKRGGMFCSVEDAFDNKTLDFPSLGGGGGGRSRGSATPSDGSSSPAPPPPPRSPGAATAGGMSDGCRQVRAWGWLGAPLRPVPSGELCAGTGDGQRGAAGAARVPGAVLPLAPVLTEPPCCGREAASDGSSERMAPAGGGSRRRGARRRGAAHGRARRRHAERRKMSNPGKRSGPRGTVRGSGRGVPGSCRPAAGAEEPGTAARPGWELSAALGERSAAPGLYGPEPRPPAIAASGAGPFCGGGLA